MALVYMAFTDALVAVFGAKYTYQFWRPITAVRNGDQHGNMAIKRDAGWLPLVDAPLHPEYPCAHCISAATVGQVLQSELGDNVGPMTMTSPTAPGVTRRWDKVSDVVQEVSHARVWSGVHYRFLTEAGMKMGKEIGTYAVKEFLQPLRCDRNHLDSRAFQRCRVRSSMPAISQASATAPRRCAQCGCLGPAPGDLRGRSFVLAFVEDRRDFF